MVHPETMNYVPNDAKFTSVQEIRHLRCFYQGHPGARCCDEVTVETLLKREKIMALQTNVDKQDILGDQNQLQHY